MGLSCLAEPTRGSEPVRAPLAHARCSVYLLIASCCSASTCFLLRPPSEAGRKYPPGLCTSFRLHNCQLGVGKGQRSAAKVHACWLCSTQHCCPCSTAWGLWSWTTHLSNAKDSKSFTSSASEGSSGSGGSPSGSSWSEPDSFWPRRSCIADNGSAVLSQPLLNTLPQSLMQQADCMHSAWMILSEQTACIQHG